MLYGHIPLQNYRTLIVGIRAKRGEIGLVSKEKQYCKGWVVPFASIDSRVAWYQEKKVNARENRLQQECSTAVVTLDTLDGWYRGWMGYPNQGCLRSCSHMQAWKVVLVSDDAWID